MVGDYKYYVLFLIVGIGYCFGFREYWCKRKKRIELFYVIEGE